MLCRSILCHVCHVYLSTCLHLIYLPTLQMTRVSAAAFTTVSGRIIDDPKGELQKVGRYLGMYVDRLGR